MKSYIGRLIFISKSYYGIYSAYIACRSMIASDHIELNEDILKSDKHSVSVKNIRILYRYSVLIHGAYFHFPS